jgi:5'/3'-nucleotidase SurE
MDTFGPQIWGDNKTAELAVTGPNVGGNRWLQLPFSGTVGAAVEAVKKGVPAIAFSGASGPGPQNYSVLPVPEIATVYAELATFLVGKVVDSGAPYLPADTFLNVNFPNLSDRCKTVSDFKWVLTRVTFGLFSPDDVHTCGRNKLPTEFEVGFRNDCFISVSVGDAADKTTARADKQAVVLDKLKDVLTCLP